MPFSTAMWINSSSNTAKSPMAKAAKLPSSAEVHAAIERINQTEPKKTKKQNLLIVCKTYEENGEDIFFDFDDTLFTHYVNQQFGDDDVIMTSLLQAETKEQGSGYRVYDTLGKPNQLMQIFIEEETDKIPKFCITWVADSIMLKFKKQWLDKYYPGKITDLVGTSSPERKIKTMQIIASAYDVPINDVLFVDGERDKVAQAIECGFCGMTTIEVMTKMYEKYGEKH